MNPKPSAYFLRSPVDSLCVWWGSNPQPYVAMTHALAVLLFELQTLPVVGGGADGPTTGRSRDWPEDHLSDVRERIPGGLRRGRLLDGLSGSLCGHSRRERVSGCRLDRRGRDRLLRRVLRGCSLLLDGCLGRSCLLCRLKRCRIGSQGALFRGYDLGCEQLGRLRARFLARPLADPGRVHADARADLDLRLPDGTHDRLVQLGALLGPKRADAIVERIGRVLLGGLEREHPHHHRIALCLARLDRPELELVVRVRGLLLGHRDHGSALGDTLKTGGLTGARVVLAEQRSEADRRRTLLRVLIELVERVGCRHFLTFRRGTSKL